MNLLPEANKKPGVYYAFTSTGVELPIVDVTHPAFALDIAEEDQRDLVAKFLREGTPLRHWPKPIRNVLLRLFLRGSILARGIRSSHGTFLSGMDTYLLKLGPDMLGAAYAIPIDRRIAAALPSLGVRLRLQDVAHLMAEIALPVLQTGLRRPLHFVNIAGGPAIDSLNALILLDKKHPGINTERQVLITVLDRDEVGPAFGKSALNAMQRDGAPLSRTRVILQHVRYDWARETDLEPVLCDAEKNGALVICSSEGGLFEYGSDDEVRANLTVLRSHPPVLAVVVGSVTRDDDLTLRLRQTSGAATRPRGLHRFRALAAGSGWTVARAIERPFSDQVLLTPRT